MRKLALGLRAARSCRRSWCIHALLAVLLFAAPVFSQTKAAPEAAVAPQTKAGPKATVFSKAAHPLSEANPSTLTTFSGQVVDRTGGVVANARITLRFADGTIRSTGTDETGRFRLNDVPAGDYVLVVERPGFQKKELNVRAVAGATSAQTIQLDVATATTTASPPKPKAKKGKKGDSQNYGVVEIFYATDRGRADTAQRVSYGPDRNSDGGLALGSAKVSIPRDHKMGDMERPSIWRFEFREDPEKHIIIQDVSQLDYGSFYANLSLRVAQSSKKQAFVFIHGYNVPFDDAVRRTAQLAYDLAFDGAPILYSWPSRGETASYAADEATIEWTVPHLQWFLTDVARKTGAQQVHLIAHSMGNRALANALVNLQREPNPPKFNQVVLAAPDIDLGVFLNLASQLSAAGAGTTLYASSNDRALQVSRQFHQAQRAGDVAPRIAICNRIETIDVSALDTNFLGHSYYGDNTSVISDLYYLLGKGSMAAERFRLQKQTTADGSYWRFVQ